MENEKPRPHILAEIYDCDPNALNNRELIEELLVKVALEAGAEVRGRVS